MLVVREWRSAVYASKPARSRVASQFSVFLRLSVRFREEYGLLARPNRHLHGELIRSLHVRGIAAGALVSLRNVTTQCEY